MHYPAVYLFHLFIFHLLLILVHVNTMNQLIGKLCRLMALKNEHVQQQSKWCILCRPAMCRVCIIIHHGICIKSSIYTCNFKYIKLKNICWHTYQPSRFSQGFLNMKHWTWFPDQDLKIAKKSWFHKIAVLWFTMIY